MVYPSWMHMQLPPGQLSISTLYRLHLTGLTVTGRNMSQCMQAAKLMEIPPEVHKRRYSDDQVEPVAKRAAIVSTRPSHRTILPRPGNGASQPSSSYAVPSTPKKRGRPGRLDRVTDLKPNLPPTFSSYVAPDHGHTNSLPPPSAAAAPHAQVTGLPSAPVQYNLLPGESNATIEACNGAVPSQEPAQQGSTHLHSGYSNYSQRRASDSKVEQSRDAKHTPRDSVIPMKFELEFGPHAPASSILPLQDDDSSILPPILRRDGPGMTPHDPLHEKVQESIVEPA